MNSVGLIGCGRFGKVLAHILRKGFTINAYDPHPQMPIPGVEFRELDEVLEERTIFVAVPIRNFNTVIQTIGPLLRDNTTVLDVCSVKKYPVTIMRKYLPEPVGIIATHPLFGPDSFTTAAKLKMMMNPTRDVHQKFNFWKAFFSSQGIEIITMDADSHDRIAARTQGVTHFLGRSLKAFGIQKSPLDTKGFNDLLDLVEQTCNDTWDLYQDLQRYNPYTGAMIRELQTALEYISSKLNLEDNHER